MEVDRRRWTRNPAVALLLIAVMQLGLTTRKRIVVKHL